MDELKRTIFYDRHKGLGAKIVEFGGWEMPIHYPSGIVEEHLATRKGAWLFDVSHEVIIVPGETAAREELRHRAGVREESGGASHGGAMQSA